MTFTTLLLVSESKRGHVLVLEPNMALRTAVVTLLSAEDFSVETLDSFEQVLKVSGDATDTVALVAWQSMQGLLAEEHRHNLVEISRNVRLVVMVPRHWARLLENTDLATSVAAIVAKPFEADELLAKIDAALRTPVDLVSYTTDSHAGTGTSRSAHV